MTTKTGIWIGVIIIAIVVGYWFMGYWYYSYGNRPDYLDFTDDGVEIAPVLIEKYSFNGSEYETYSQSMVLRGYLPRVYPDIVCGNSQLLAFYKCLSICFMPMNRSIRWINGDPLIITDEYTVVDGQRLMKK